MFVHNFSCSQSIILLKRCFLEIKTVNVGNFFDIHSSLNYYRECYLADVTTHRVRVLKLLNNSIESTLNKVHCSVSLRNYYPIARFTMKNAKANRVQFYKSFCILLQFSKVFQRRYNICSEHK